MTRPDAPGAGSAALPSGPDRLTPLGPEAVALAPGPDELEWVLPCSESVLLLEPRWPGPQSMPGPVVRPLTPPGPAVISVESWPGRPRQSSRSAPPLLLEEKLLLPPLLLELEDELLPCANAAEKDRAKTVSDTVAPMAVFDINDLRMSLDPSPDGSH